VALDQGFDARLERALVVSGVSLLVHVRPVEVLPRERACAHSRRWERAPNARSHCRGVIAPWRT
jgi:hypothetical protein